MGKRAAVFAALAVVVAGVGVGVFLYLRSHGAGPLPAPALSLPADSVLVVGADVPRLLASEAYKKVRGLAGPVDPFADLKEKSGIDIERDVDQIVLSAANPRDGQPDVVGVAIGRFDRSKLAPALEARPGTSRKEHHGTAVFVAEDMAVAVLDDRTLALGTPGRVETFVADRAQGRQPLLSNAELGEALRRIRPGTALWLVGGQEFTSRVHEGLPARPGMPDLSTVKTVTLTVDVDPALDLRLGLELEDAKTTEGLATMLRGFLSLAALGAAQDQPELKELTSAINVTTDGARLEVRAQVAYPTLDTAVFDSLKRSRIRSNESVVIGDVRTVITAQTAYQVTFGEYAELRCLTEPAACRPGYAGPVFLYDDVAQAVEKHGYRRKLYLGGNGFAYTAVPAGPDTGTRGFCGDASGVICATADGREPEVVDARCAPGCERLN